MENNNRSSVYKSGNSDVDVTVNINTSALAYAYACYMHASGQLNDVEFNQMIQNLDQLIKGKRPRIPATNRSTESLQKHGNSRLNKDLFQLPQRLNQGNPFRLF